MKRGLFLLTILLFVGATAALAQTTCPYGLPGMYDLEGEYLDDVGEWWHGDDCKPGEQWWCDFLDQVHNRDYCHNGDGTYSIHCWDLHENSPKQSETDCDTDVMSGYLGTMRRSSCSNRATVLCPGLGDSGLGDWITFECYLNETGDRRVTGAAGILRVDAQGHPDKGVSCISPYGPMKECGCHVNSATTSSFFGRRSRLGPNRFECLQ